MTNNELNLIIGSTFDPSGANKGLEAFKQKAQKITNVIDLGNGYKQFDQLTTYVNKAGESFTHLKTILQDEKKESVVLRDEIQSVSNSLQFLNINSQNASKNLQNLSTSTKTTQNNLQNISVSTSSTSNNLSAISVSSNNASKNLQRLSTSVNLTASTTSNLTSNTNNLTTSTRLAREEAEKLDLKQKALTQTTNKASQSFANIVQKVAKFYLATLPIQMVQRAITTSFREAINVIKEYDSALTELQKVSTLSGEALENYSAELAKIGSTVARTNTEMIESVTNMKKAGFSDDDAKELARISSLYQNTADEELTASEATSVLVSQMKAFKDEFATASDAIKITDAINIVSQDFAVSSADLGKGLTQAGASLQTYGNSFYETVGLLTAGTEIFQGKSQQVARALNMIASRTVKAKDTLAEYGIEINNADGSLRSTYDILSDLSKQWNNLSNAEQIAIGTEMAGVNQYKVFSAIMGNFGTAIEATNEAMNIHGATMRQNAVYMESIKAKTSALKQEFEKLVLSGGVLQNMFKGVLDALTNILKFLNTDFGKATVSIGLVSASIVALILNFSKLETVATIVGTFFKYKLIPAFIQFGATISSTGNIVQAFSVALETLNVNPIMLAISAITALGIALAYLTVKEKEALNKSRETLSTFKDEYKSVTEEIKDAETQLEDIRKKIDEINSTDGATLTKEGELEELEKQKKELERILEIKKELEVQKKKEAEDQLKETLSEKVDYKSYGQRAEIGGLAIGTGVWLEPGISYKTEDRLTALQDLAITLEKYYQLREEFKEKESLGELTEAERWEFENLEKEIEYTRAKSAELAETLLSDIEGFDKENESVRRVNAVLNVYNTTLSLLGINTENDKDSTNDFSDAEEQLDNITDDTNESLEEQVTTLEELAKAQKDLNTAIDNIQSAYQTLKDAVDDYNKNQVLTLDHLQALMALDDEYIGALSFENGQLKLNSDFIKKKIDAQIAEQKMIIINNAIERLHTLGQKENSEALSDNETKIREQSEALRENDIELQKNTAYRLANSLVTSSQGEYGKEVEQIMKDMDVQLKLSDDYINQLTFDWTNGMKDSSKSTRDARDELEDLEKQYEKVISYIKNKIKSEIDVIKEAKTAETKSIEERINSLKDLKDKEEEYWDEKINALKEQNEQLESQIEKEKLLENLAKAKSKKVRVYREGQGYVYEEDLDSIAKAQSQLDEYNRKKEYEDKLAELENYKDKALKNYEKQIDDLEAYKKAVEKSYDEQIEYFQKYLDQFEMQTDAFVNEQDRLLAEQLTGIDFEKQGWQSRLNNLADFVTKYNNLLKQIGSDKYIPSYQDKTLAKSPYTSGINFEDFVKGRRASGDSFISKDGAYLVGESPNTELVIGSKLNNGTVMGLPQGSGVVNAKSTNTLAGILNNLGALSGHNFNLANNGTQGTNISIGNISLPNVSNGKEFVDYLQDFSLQMVGKSYA